MAGTAPWPRWDCTRPDRSPAPRFHHARLAAAQAAYRARRAPVQIITAEALLCEQPLADGRQCPYHPSTRADGKRVCGNHARMLHLQEVTIHG